jgi:tetratricopeptide (TPR) repeat protein
MHRFDPFSRAKRSIRAHILSSGAVGGSDIHGTDSTEVVGATSMRLISILICTLIGTAVGTIRAADGPSLHLLQKVPSQRFDIHYDLLSEDSPVSAVQLWYTTDDGMTWRNFGVDDDNVSPIAFRANDQGRHGFFVIAFNETGPSSPPPNAETVPQQWAFVDFTPPVLQVHELRRDETRTFPATVQIRWSAFDNALASRPIMLEYQHVRDDRWLPIDGPIENSGVYDWRVPENLIHSFRVRVKVRDFIGNTSVASTRPFTVERQPIELKSASPLRAATGRLASRKTNQRMSAGFDRQQVQDLFNKAKNHRARGEYRLAASRLRDLLAISPQDSDALVELGRVLYADNRRRAAIEAFELALKQEPSLRSARQELALAMIDESRFDEAVMQLAEIVQMNPNDVESWLNLGDIAIYQGDELLAREHYVKAMTRDPSNPRIIESARSRLTDLKSLAKRFTQTDVQSPSQ